MKTKRGCERYITYTRLKILLRNEIQFWDIKVKNAEDNLREDVPERIGVLCLNEFLQKIKELESIDGRKKQKIKGVGNE